MKTVEIEDQCPSIAKEVNHCNKIDSLYVQDSKSDYERWALFFLLKALDCFLKEKQSEGDTKLHVLCVHTYKAIVLMNATKKNYDERCWIAMHCNLIILLWYSLLIAL